MCMCIYKINIFVYTFHFFLSTFLVLNSISIMHSIRYAYCILHDFALYILYISIYILHSTFYNLYTYTPSYVLHSMYAAFSILHSRY